MTRAFRRTGVANIHDQNFTHSRNDYLGLWNREKTIDNRQETNRTKNQEPRIKSQESRAFATLKLCLFEALPL